MPYPAPRKPNWDDENSLDGIDLSTVPDTDVPGEGDELKDLALLIRVRGVVRRSPRRAAAP